MTFSICVRETFTDEDGAEHVRFGVAVTTNNPGIGSYCPFVSEHGAVATQAYTTGDLAPRILGYFDDGLAVEDVLPAVLRRDDAADARQVHALDADGRAVHHGDFEADDAEGGDYDWFGDVAGTLDWADGSVAYSIAGNVLAGESVVTETARAYADASPERRLAKRLIDALTTGVSAGGDRRDELVGSAAVHVVDPTAPIADDWYNDLRIGASETPVSDLDEAYELAVDSHDRASDDW